MDSSFTPIEQMLKFRASRHEDFPYQEILLTRLCMHMQGKLLENRNKMLKAQGINETLPASAINGERPGIFARSASTSASLSASTLVIT